MVVLMDYSCPSCGGIPGHIAGCSHCEGSGKVRLPCGTLPTTTDLTPIENDTGNKVDIINGVPFVNGVGINCEIDELIKILDCLDCNYDIEEFDTYEIVDCVDFMESDYGLPYTD